MFEPFLEEKRNGISVGEDKTLEYILFFRKQSKRERRTTPLEHSALAGGNEALLLVLLDLSLAVVAWEVSLSKADDCVCTTAVALDIRFGDPGNTEFQSPFGT